MFQHPAHYWAGCNFINERMANCLDNIIGLSPTAGTACVPAAPLGYNTSLSGLHLTGLTPLDELMGYGDCAGSDLWDLLTDARNEATSTLLADANALMLRHFAQRREMFRGSIGEGAASDTLVSAKAYAGLRIAANPVRGGVLKIKNISTLFSNTGTVTVWIYNALNQLIATKICNTTANVVTSNAQTDITLPLSIPFSSATEYFLVFSRNNLNLPKVNRLGCGCGGFNPSFDLSQPFWAKNRYIGTQAWANWLMFSAWEGDDLVSFHQCPSASSNTNMNGLLLEIETYCDTSELICNASKDFQRDPLALSLAYAVRYKAAELIADKMLTTTNLTRANVVNRDIWKAMRAEWNAKYQEYVTYISQNVPITQNDCLVCNDTFKISKQTMFA